MDEAQFLYWQNIVNKIEPLDVDAIFEGHAKRTGHGFIIGNENSYQLARFLRNEKGFDGLPISDKRSIAEYWYCRNHEIIHNASSTGPRSDSLANNSFNHFWAEFLSILPDIVVWNLAMLIEEATNRPLPPEALLDEVASCPPFQRLLAVCKYLSEHDYEDKDQFRIGCGQAGDIIGANSYQGGSCLKALCTLGRLKRLEKGQRGQKHSLYEYIKLN